MPLMTGVTYTAALMLTSRLRLPDQRLYQTCRGSSSQKKQTSLLQERTDRRPFEVPTIREAALPRRFKALNGCMTL